MPTAAFLRKTSKLVRSLAILTIAGGLSLAQNQKKIEPKPPEIEVLSATARFDENRISVDATVRNIGERTAKRLLVSFEVLDNDRTVLTRQTATIDPADLEPEAEASVSAQMRMHARAVAVRLTFEEAGSRYVKSKNTGPFAIE